MVGAELKTDSEEIGFDGVEEFVGRGWWKGGRGGG
jgi:hypothetical protein